MTSKQAPRTMAIPSSPAPANLVEARRRRHGDAYGCIVCGLPTPKPKFYCHVVEGGSRALHPDDEGLYESDGGDMNFLPLGENCRRRFSDLRPFAVKADLVTGQENHR